MNYDEAIALLRSWVGIPVVVRLEPEVSVMAGVLSELPGDGIDGVLFAVDAPQRTGVALALFRDAVTAAQVQAGALVVEQGQVTVTVTRSG